MSDLISRDDVLHELDGCDYELKDWQRWKLKTMVRDIPSTDPKTPSNGSITSMNSENTHDRTMGDLISRQDAIDAVNAYLGLSAVSRTIQNMTSIQEILENLPSVEPEIIRCRDCKYFHYEKPYIVYDIPVLGHEVCDKWGDGCKTSEDGFCFMAERRGEADE